MKNVGMKVEGNILTIKVDPSKEFGPSSSGKTIIIATTEGNVPVPDRDEKVGLNVYRKKPGQGHFPFDGKPKRACHENSARGGS